MWGYIDTTGKVVIEPQFADAEDFSEGMACVALFDDKGWIRGYVDTTGKLVIKPKFESGENFASGLARVAIRSNRKAVDPHGREYELLKYGYIDRLGKYVWKPSI